MKNTIFSFPTMDITHRNNLRFCRQKIVEDLNVLDVIDSLIEKDIVNEEDQEKILSEKTRKAQVRSLLDTIPLRGPRAYSIFIESLKEKYSWLVEELESKDTSDKTDFSETNHLNDILLKGGVPHPPSFSITRFKEVNERIGILKFKNDEYICSLMRSKKVCRS